jgi:hypothetical protein
MSKSINGRNRNSNVSPRPIKPGSVLYRILEMIAREVADKLNTESSSGKRSQ